jgi:Tol biopolymer transport system component
MWVSKDASRVAFRAFEDSTWDLFLLDVTGGRRVRLREPQGDFALSGDGTTLAVAMPTGSGTARIHLLHTEKEEERLVSVRWFESESANPESSLYSGLQLMTISRDGTRIAFMLSYALNRNDIYALDLAKGTFLNITGSKGNNSWPFLSEDGRYLVFSSDRHRDQDIFLFDMETRTMKHLMLSDFDEYPEGISAGGGRILFRRDRSHFVLDREGDRIIPIPGGKLDWGWPSLSRDGRWVLGSGVRERRVALFLHRLPD